MTQLGRGTYNWQDLTIYNTYSLWLWGEDWSPGQTRTVRIRSGSHDSDSFGQISIDQASYFNNGPGQHVTLAHSNAVQFFFGDLMANGAAGFGQALIDNANKVTHTL